jgi:DNA-binding transcriptional ArsR family regulator
MNLSTQREQNSRCRQHNVTELDCGRSLEKFPRIIAELKGMLERFMQSLSCIDQCFIPDDTLERLPEPSVAGKAKVGGIDFNKARMRRAAEAILALSWRPSGFTSSELADQVTRSGPGGSGDYSARQAAYDLKKLRGKEMVERVGKTRAYRATQAGLKAIAALVVLREKAIRPLLAAAQENRQPRGSQNPTALDRHYETVRVGMAGILRELGVAA